MAPSGPMDNGFARKLLKNRTLSPAELEIYREQRVAFRLKFGRDMGPDDPFFFDPDADSPQFRSPKDADSILALIARLMGEAGVDPASIYAFRRTRGLFPTSRTRLSYDQMLEWNAAVGEYRSKLARTATQ
jgi:hypothetical protein